MFTLFHEGNLNSGQLGRSQKVWFNWGNGCLNFCQDTNHLTMRELLQCTWGKLLAHILQAKPSGIQFSLLINWILVHTIMVLSKHNNISSFFSFLVPIRSCREFAERCNSKTDGLYTIFLQKPNAAETVKVFCDMTHDGGGWTLLVTSASNKGWTKDNVKSR